MKDGTKKDARQRILDVAGGIFAEKGFKAVTVREICSKAGANIAAINYHFGGKEGLYRAVVGHSQAVSAGKYPPDLGLDEKSGPEDRLRAFIRSFLFRMLEEGRPSWFGKFVAREFIEPTPALDILVEETIRPSFNLLSSIVRQLLGGSGGEETVRLICASIIGQCLYFHNARPVTARLFKREGSGAREIERTAEHITAFSLHAIKHLASGGHGGVGGLK